MVTGSCHDYQVDYAMHIRYDYTLDDSILKDCVIEDVRFDEEIGKGANGSILEARWKGVTVAVKEIHSIFMYVSEPEFLSFKRSFMRECEQSSRLRHPNIVRFFGIYYPPNARVPSLVMERLHCSLTKLLENNTDICIGRKLSIICDVARGLRYLQTRAPPIMHRDLSSNNVLISKRMEGKIDLITARFVGTSKQSQMTKAPEALEDSLVIRYSKELDVFSFGCVMLHTLSHQWPTPLPAVVTDPETGLVKGGRSEVERRSEYFDRIDRSIADVLTPLIENCLNNLPEKRTSIMRVCEQLEDLVDKECVPIDDLTVSTLQEEIQKKENEMQRRNKEIQRSSSKMQTEIQSKDAEIEAHISNCKLSALHLPTKQVSKSSSDFWNNLKVTWQRCADMPEKCWVVSVAKLNGKVYVAGQSEDGGYQWPFMYDSNKDQWSALPDLPCWYFSLVTVTKKQQLLAIGGVVNDNLAIAGTVKVVDEFSSKVFLWNEKYNKWLTPYPNMPTARSSCSSISHGLTVIVAGGVTCLDPPTITRSVEVLHINDNNLHDSYWSVVEQLPHVVCEAIPLIVYDKLYITEAYTCNVVSASLPELLQSSSNNTSSSQVWSKLPDMPYSSFSINHYQGHLITFTGDHMVERPGEDKPVCELVPLIHIYNPDTKTWDCIGDIPIGYYLCMSVHIRENKILFIGGLTGTHDTNKDDDIMTTCSILTLTPQ